MGVFDDWSGKIGDTIAPSSYREFQSSGALGPVNQILSDYGGETGQMILDPMDLSGERAGATRDEVKSILLKSAREGIAQQEEQEQFLRDRYQLYYEAATGEGGALSQIEAMATGGEIDYTPSKIYQYQRRRGLENIKVGAAKSGLLHSSARQESEADLLGGLAAEEAQRAYGGQLSRLQLGSGAAEAVSAASGTVSGNIGSLYSGLAGGLNAITQAYGQAREASFQTAGNTLSNLGAYQAQQV